MEIARIADMAQAVGKEITIQGWVYSRTDKGKLCFLLVRDGTGFAQCVAFKGDLTDALFDKIMRLPQESSVFVRGGEGG
jgi:asparaginyl-tRNA synthetase